MRIEIIRITFLSGQFHPADIPRIRAYFSRVFPDFTLLHNHEPSGGFRYVYPEVQFKFIASQLMIIGYGKGFRVLSQIFNRINTVEINHREIAIPEKSIQIYKDYIGIHDTFNRFRFITPWMALNQKNYREFMRLNSYERELKLNRILWGNFKTVAHAFDYWIPDPDKIKVNGHFEMRESRFKGNTMLTFRGDFVTNFCIPEYLGLGKQVARGYGTVQKTKERI